MIPVTLLQTLQRQFDPEDAYRKPPLILKIVSHAGYETYGLHWRKPTNSREARGKSSNGREEKLERNSDAASGTIFLYCAFKKARKKFSLIFSLKWQPKI
jgi:hypothetical protein